MALRGPLPDVDIPAVSLFDHVFGNLTPAVRDKVAIVHAPTGQELTFGQLAASVERVAAWFAAHGVDVGDAVALALPTSPDYVTAFHGIARAGAAASPMNVKYAQREFADQLELVKAKYVVVHAMLLPLVAAAAAQVGMAPEQVIVVGAGGPEAPEAPSAASAGHTAYEDLLTCTAPVPAANVSDPATHVACLPLSSGIGGLMRPVMLTHRNLVANATQISPVMDCFPGEHTLVAFLPLSHVYALTVSVNFVLATRHRLVTLPVFHPEDFLGAIQKYKATMLSIVPSVASLLARHPMVDAFDVSSVKVVISGAAPISEELGDALAARVGCPVL